MLEILQAAAQKGLKTMAVMPNSHPFTDSAKLYKYIYVTVLQKSRQIHLGKIIIIITVIIIIIIDNFCIALFSDVHKLTALYNTLQHFLSENKIIKGNNVHESNTYIYI